MLVARKVLAMTDRVCLLNNRACRCDPDAAVEKSRPCMLARRIGKLMRLLASNIESEAIGAATALRRVQQAEGFSFNVLANLIESFEKRKYSDSDAAIFFMRGEEKGRREAASKQRAPPEFYDADGHPRWHEIAVFCQENSLRLRDEWERNFANDIVSKIIKYGGPTEKQGRCLLAIFVKLGGRYDPKAVHLRR
jgi:hypothetical protein